MSSDSPPPICSANEAGRSRQEGEFGLGQRISRPDAAGALATERGTRLSVMTAREAIPRAANPGGLRRTITVVGGFVRGI